jgi:hypothetical protein
MTARNRSTLTSILSLQKGEADCAFMTLLKKKLVASPFRKRRGGG